MRAERALEDAKKACLALKGELTGLLDRLDERLTRCARRSWSRQCVVWRQPVQRASVSLKCRKVGGGGAGITGATHVRAPAFRRLGSFTEFRRATLRQNTNTVVVMGDRPHLVVI